MSKAKKHPGAVALGKLGGKTTGKAKARSREQCQRAARVRWEKYKAEKAKQEEK